MQSTPLNKRQNLTELRVICVTVGGRAKLAFQPRSLSQISQNQAQKVKIPNIEVQKHRSWRQTAVQNCQTTQGFEFSDNLGSTLGILTSNEYGTFLVTDRCTGQVAQWDLSFVAAAAPFTNTRVRMCITRPISLAWNRREKCITFKLHYNIFWSF